MHLGVVNREWTVHNRRRRRFAQRWDGVCVNDVGGLGLGVFTTTPSNRRAWHLRNARAVRAADDRLVAERREAEQRPVGRVEQRALRVERPPVRTWR